MADGFGERREFGVGGRVGHSVGHDPWAWRRRWAALVGL
jgi:hypothetical protein